MIYIDGFALLCATLAGAPLPPLPPIPGRVVTHADPAPPQLPAGASSAQILAWIGCLEVVRADELARALGTSLGTAYSRLAGLQAAGAIERALGGWQLAQNRNSTHNPRQLP